MKAHSPILASAQKPFMIFGIPAKLIGLVAAAASPIYAVLVLLNFMTLAFVAFLLMLIGGCLFLARKASEDCHIEHIIMIARPFFKGKTTRHLLCGKPQAKKNKKERPF
jgi:hypothetical protein